MKTHRQATALLAAALLAIATSAAAQSPDPTPADSATGPAWVTGTISGGTGGQVSSGAADADGVTRYRFLWEDMRIAMSDPRLSGLITSISDQDVHTGAAGDVPTFSVGAGTYRIENETGSWEGPNIFLWEGSVPTDVTSDTGLFVGSGAYEGLSAFLAFDFSQTPASVVEVIVPGDLPPVVTFE
jgi:hypothetical protein